jgi:hypothetical protein
MIGWYRLMCNICDDAGRLGSTSVTCRRRRDIKQITLRIASVTTNALAIAMPIMKPVLSAEVNMPANVASEIDVVDVDRLD